MGMFELTPLCDLDSLMRYVTTEIDYTSSGSSVVKKARENIIAFRSLAVGSSLCSL